MRDAYVFDAIRTPRGKGKANGALAAIAPHELVRQVIDALRVRTGGAPDAVDRFDLSCVGQIGAQGGHLALVSLCRTRPRPGRDHGRQPARRRSEERRV